MVKPFLYKCHVLRTLKQYLLKNDFREFQHTNIEKLLM